jgi:hypothetical protein
MVKKGEENDSEEERSNDKVNDSEKERSNDKGNESTDSGTDGDDLFDAGTGSSDKGILLNS